MSAMNYTECPRCRARLQAERNAALKRVMVMYGAVPVAEYEAAKAAVPVIGKPALTFREDWEVTGAPTGTVTVGYYAGCEVCDLKVTFKDRHPVEPAVLEASRDITCDADVPDKEYGEDMFRRCGAMSRYLVERSDGDTSFGLGGSEESCEAHLADTVTGMIDGDPAVRAVVMVRWTPPGGTG